VQSQGRCHGAILCWAAWSLPPARWYLRNRARRFGG